MMRLTETARNSEGVWLAVEGWIAGEDSGLLEAECTAILDTGIAVHLDCSGITHVDLRGVATLRRLRRRLLRITTGPPFLVELVDRAADGGHVCRGSRRETPAPEDSGA